MANSVGRTEEITMPKHQSQGPRVRERAKSLLASLLAFANGELDGCDRLPIEAVWKEDLSRAGTYLLTIRTKRRFLEELTKVSLASGKTTTAKHQRPLSAEEVREALANFKTYLQILEDNRTKTRGAEDWHFTLKLRSQDTAENLQHFDREWEQRRATKSQPATGDGRRAHYQEAQLANERGIEEYRQGHWEAALSHFNRALKLVRDYPEALYNRGLVYEQLLDRDRARTDYKQAILGGLVAAYNNLARLEIAEGENEREAVQLLLAGLRRASDREERYALLKNLGWVRLQQKRHAEAKIALGDAIALHPDRAEARGLLAQVYDARGDSSNARREWENFLKYASTHDPEQDDWIALARQRVNLIPARQGMRSRWGTVSADRSRIERQALPVSQTYELLNDF